MICHEFADYHIDKVVKLNRDESRSIKECIEACIKDRKSRKPNDSKERWVDLCKEVKVNHWIQ